MKKIYSILFHIRELNERQKRKELLDVISARIQKEREIKELEKEKQRASSGISENEEGISAWFLAHFLHYIEGLREEKKRKEEELLHIMMLEEKRREDYLESKREKDIAKRLLERKKAQEMREQLKREEKIADEIAMLKHQMEKEEK